MIPWLALGGAAHAHVPIIYITGPDEDWCAVINGTIGNDLVMLNPGEYVGPCDIVAKPSNVEGESTTVESIDPVNPATFVGTSADYVLRMDGEILILLQLAFADLPAGVDAIRVGDIDVGWVRFCWFDRIAGTAVRQVGAVGTLFRFTESELHEVALGSDLGCGGACALPWVDVGGNLILDGGAAHVVRGGTGLVFDEVIARMDQGITLGGGVDVTGSLLNAAGPALVLEGPTKVGATVLIGEPAVDATAPGLHDVRIVGSTLWGSLTQGDWGPGRNLALVDDAIRVPLQDMGGADVTGTVECDDACFVDTEDWDFFPAPGSPVRGAAVADPDLGQDFCGRYRGDPPTAGAIEAFGDVSFGALTPTFKRDMACDLPEPETPPETATADTAPPVDSGAETASEPAAGGCGGGCGSVGGGAPGGSGAGPLLAAVLALGKALRRGAPVRR